jgi:RNase adapter protein RapZ
MKFIIITGMSGAGKSAALKMMEDFGYYCVDNLPIPLILKFAELADTSEELQKVALGVDIRGRQGFKEIEETLALLTEKNVNFEILFLEADDTTLIKRFKETRRNHPLALYERVDIGIQAEREQLAYLKGKANYILDTSKLLTRELKAELESIFVNNKDYKSLFVSVVSFGFKYGIPTDSDLVFDVRFLPNPYYIEELKPLNGNDELVQSYVMKFPQSVEFLQKLVEMVSYLIPYYIEEGKNQLVISIGCTGGKHRSVTLANKLFQQLQERKDFGVRIEHRDIGKDAIRKS